MKNPGEIGDAFRSPQEQYRMDILEQRNPLKALVDVIKDNTKTAQDVVAHITNTMSPMYGPFDVSLADIRDAPVAQVQGVLRTAVRQAENARAFANKQILDYLRVNNAGLTVQQEARASEALSASMNKMKNMIQPLGIRVLKFRGGEQALATAAEEIQNAYGMQMEDISLPLADRLTELSTAIPTMESAVVRTLTDMTPLFAGTNMDTLIGLWQCYVNACSQGGRVAKNLRDIVPQSAGMVAGKTLYSLLN